MSGRTPPGDRGGAVLRGGFVADGVFKLATAALFAVGARWLATRLDAPAWLVLAAAVTLALCGVVELALARTGDLRRSTRFLVAYDSGWVLVTVAAVLLAWSTTPGGGWAWLGYQAVGATALGAVFAVAVRRARATAGR